MATPISASAPVPVRSPAAGGVREVTRLAYPIVLTQMSQTLMQVVDSIFVGQLGAAQLGALGFAAIWLWTVISVFSGTANGVQTFVSQAQGAGDEQSAGGWAWQGLYAVVPALTISVFAFVAIDAWLWTITGASPEIREHAIAYASMRPYGMVGLGVWMVLSAFLRGVGDTRTPLIATILANALNAVLTWALVFGHLGLPQLGVAGAGLATSIAETAGAVLLAIALVLPAVRRRYRTQFAAPDLRAIRRFLYTGLPIGGQWLLDMGAFALFTTLVARMGNASMAATQAMISLLSLSFMQAIGIGLAATTLVGRYKGAGDLDAAVRSYRSARKLGLWLATGIAVLFVAAPEALLSIYTSDAEVLRLGRPLLALGAAFQLFDAVQIVANGALRGAGDTRWSFLVQTGIAWFVRLPLAWLFAVTWNGGVVGAWYAEFIFILVLTAALVWRFRSGVWKQLQI